MWWQLRDIVETAKHDRGIGKVEDLVERFALTVRQLQRHFLQYVGVPPKWVIQRYRLHDALAEMEQQQEPDWADLAARLGYTDQAHFVRDFRASTGMAPRAYFRQPPRW
jgi:AraC-like DNA-binding protein